jgi:hypothetical protein
VSDNGFHVFVKAGDATAELQNALRELRLSEEKAGIHRHLFVTRANQSVVMVRDLDAPIVSLLRRSGWSQPADDS